MLAENWTELRCHPATRTTAVRAIRALARRSESALEAKFRLAGDLAQISVPPSGPVRIGNELWRHTCFEAFIGLQGRTSYHEYNLSPSGEWAVYAFREYRDGGVLHDESMRPQIAVRSTPDSLELDAAIRLDRLSREHPHASLLIGLSAVVETNHGLSYWALLHSGEKADFHRADSFALLLKPLGRDVP